MAIWHRKNKDLNNRSVNLSKSPPNAVFSYYSKRPESGNSNRRRSNTGVHKVIKITKQLPVIVASIAIVISISYVMTLSTNPKIVTVSSQTNNKLLHSQAVYYQAAHQLLASSIINQTKITIDANSFEANMKKEFPELSNVAVTLPIMGRRPIVELQVANPALVLQVDHGSSFLIDITGRAIKPTSAISNINSFNLPTVLDQSGLPVQIGTGVLTASNVSFINTVIGQFKAKNLTIASITLPAIANELHVQLAGQPYYIKFDLQGDARAETGSFLATQQYLANNHITPAQYVDVRVEGRAYYK